MFRAEIGVVFLAGGTSIKTSILTFDKKLQDQPVLRVPEIATGWYDPEG